MKKGVKIPKYTKKYRHKSLGRFISQEKIHDVPYFLPGADFFTPITRESIKPGDWLEDHKDKGQPYDRYTRYNPVTSRRNKIYIVSLDKKDHFKMSELVEYVQAFYSTKVEIVDFKQTSIRGFHASVKRFKQRDKNLGYGTQYYVPDIFTFLKRIVPTDAYCLIAVTGVDLYPRPSWNFVFGKASLKNRIGVFSYRRYMDEPDLVFKRMGRVCTHELGHMFGITHCINYRCLMNGSNSLEESDGRPQLCCPICLRKFKKNIKFDLTRRYEALLAFFTKYQFEEQRGWVERRLQYVKDVNAKKLSPIELSKMYSKMD